MSRQAARAAVLVGAALALAGCQSLSAPPMPPRPGSGIGAWDGSGSGEERGTGSGATPEIRRAPASRAPPRGRIVRRQDGTFKCVLRAIGKISGKAEFVETCDRQ